MSSSRVVLVALLLGALAPACAKTPAPGPTALPDQDTGVADTSSESPPLADTEPDTRPGCPPGATAEDCQLCAYGGETCKRACPKVDCSVFPPPAECAPFCGSADCCECRREIGNEYWWRPPQRPITCGTSCTGARAAWAALMRDPRMIACKVDQDCAQAGGPSPPSCDCRPAIGGACFQAVNASAYQSLGAAAIEQQYLASCSDAPRICDCAPGVPGCVNGACVTKQLFCCNCPADAGAP
jgi:hypothetical protein